MLNIIMCGAPGCGKGTQSDLIVEKYSLKHLSTGDLLRKEIENKTLLGKEAESYISKGNLVPDEMIIKILTSNIEAQDENNNGVILDGLLNKLNKKSTVLIDIQVDNQELINRLLKRGETSGRSDDNLETIKKRLDVYLEKTKPVSNYYKQLNKYATIDGMGEVTEIFDRITSVIDENFQTI